jgi:hypothetical protein
VKESGEEKMNSLESQERRLETLSSEFDVKKEVRFQ